ncbi:PGN_0703 family putative restriction endonuclease [Sphingomonas sp. PWP1-2]|uniref:PGN_0703 family putative restriction endonuclease n=1 Tax=Sphingomonas sp. PWP1-2 TaxID=2804558 RepID=UPI003CEC37BF
MKRTHLPLVPAEVLRRHRVLESFDNRFRAAARLLQALWRAENEIPIGTHAAADGTSRKLGSRISSTVGASGRNFMTPEIARLAWREHAYREPGAMVDEERLWTNLLSSHPLVFNALGPLRLDLSLATKVLRAICPDLGDADVQSVAFEHSPGRRVPDLTGDRTAWDAVIIYVRGTGKIGFVAIELKYSESAWEQQKELRERYAELMPATGLYIDPTAAALRKPPLQQFMREHVLAQASIMRGDFTEGRFIVIAPELNLPAQDACRRYASHLVTPTDQQAGFATVMLEGFIAALGEHGDAGYADALFRRYCDWSLVDDEIEANFPAKLAG